MLGPSSTRRPFGIAASVGLMVTVLVQVAQAQPTEVPPPEPVDPPPVAHVRTVVDDARSAFESGLALESEGKVAEACAAYRKRLAMVRELGPLRKVATCDASDGELLSSAALLEELLPRLVEDTERAGVAAQLAGLKARLARLTLALAPGAPAGVVAH